MNRSFCFVATAASLLLLVAGCGGEDLGRPKLHPASGTVLHGDKPLPGALVIFEPVEPIKDASGESIPYPNGTTDAQGRYTLHTYEPDDGAPAASYRIKVSTNPKHVETGETGPLQKVERPPDVLKGRYLDATTSGLQREVKPGPNEIEPLKLD